MRPKPLLLVLLLAAVLPACGSAEDEGETAAAEEVQEPAEEAAPEPPPAAPEPQAPAEDPTLRRPAEIVVTITGQEMYAGTYRAAGTTRLCGPIQTYLPGEQNAYAVEFPFEGQHKVRDLSFIAGNLPAGGTTDRLRLNLGVETASGGSPPSFRAHPGSDADDSGTATRTSEGGVDRLQVRGKSSSDTFEMTVTCRPRAG